jgi:hypothetical protein
MLGNAIKDCGHVAMIDQPEYFKSEFAFLFKKMKSGEKKIPRSPRPQGIILSIVGFNLSKDSISTLV